MQGKNKKTDKKLKKLVVTVNVNMFLAKLQWEKGTKGSKVLDVT